MVLTKPVGRGAASRKYDIISALTAFSLGQNKSTQRRTLRLIGLITARYNWTNDELSIGQRHIAKLWSVDERTVKREMARLRESGWLVLKSQGARGRVSVYSLGISQIMVDTQPSWAKIGEDFVCRMNPEHVATTKSNVVPLQTKRASPSADSIWGRSLARLREIDCATCSNWFEALTEVGVEDGYLVLLAPTKFHARFVDNNHKDLIKAAVHTLEQLEVRIIH